MPHPEPSRISAQISTPPTLGSYPPLLDGSWQHKTTAHDFHAPTSSKELQYHCLWGWIIQDLTWLQGSRQVTPSHPGDMTGSQDCAPSEGQLRGTHMTLTCGMLTSRLVLGTLATRMRPCWMILCP